MPQRTLAILLICVIAAAGVTVWLTQAVFGASLPWVGLIPVGLALSLLAWRGSRD